VLRKDNAYWVWANGPDVTYRLALEIGVWIRGLDTVSWQAPSIRDTGLSDLTLPEAEVRRAVVKGVLIVYEVIYGPFEDLVDLMSVDFA
jgi:hypothetical protein